MAMVCCISMCIVAGLIEVDHDTRFVILVRSNNTAKSEKKCGVMQLG